MTLKHIRVFNAVYQYNSISQAALSLGMTQPAASLAIRELEQHYHLKLFERSGRGIAATQAAKALYPNASRLLSLYEELDADMNNWNQSGKMRIGSSISIGSCILPQLLVDFKLLYPDLDIYVKVDSSDVIQHNVCENHLDFALIEGNIHSDQIHSFVFLEDELIPICCPSHPLAYATDVELFELKKEHFLMREKNSGTRELADSYFEIHGFHISPSWESTSTAALINAVSKGLGISILPKRMLEKQLLQKQVASFSIKDISLKRHYQLVYHKNKYISPAMKDFFSLTKKMAD